jgi:hypothetical protein
VEQQSNHRIALARDARQVTEIAESVRLTQKARAIYLELTDKGDTLQQLARKLDTWKWYARRKEENASRALEAAAREMIELHVAGGVALHELRAFPDFLLAVLDALNVGVGRMTLEDLDIEDDKAESAGNHCFTRRRVKGATAAELREEAEYQRWDARVSTSLAEALERQADKLDREHGVTFVRPMGVRA